MVITEFTQQRLVLWDRPVLISTLTGLMASSCALAATLDSSDLVFATRLFLLALALLLCCILWEKLPVQRFVFDRSSGLVRRTQWRLWKKTDDTMPIARVVEMRQMADSLGETGPTFLIAMNYKSNDGRIRMERLSQSSSGKRHDDTVERLNEWLSRPLDPEES